MRRPAERLRDILEAIARIERHTRRGRAAFEKDELIRLYQRAVNVHLSYKVEREIPAENPFDQISSPRTPGTPRRLDKPSVL